MCTHLVESGLSMTRSVVEKSLTRSTRNFFADFSHLSALPVLCPSPIMQADELERGDNSPSFTRNRPKKISFNRQIGCGNRRLMGQRMREANTASVNNLSERNI